MTKPNQEDQAEPFFIIEGVEAELIAAGYVFEPPGHVSTKNLPEILAGLTDDELAAWPSVLSKGGNRASAGWSASPGLTMSAQASLTFDGIFHGIDGG